MKRLEIRLKTNECHFGWFHFNALWIVECIPIFITIKTSITKWKRIHFIRTAYEIRHFCIVVMQIEMDWNYTWTDTGQYTFVKRDREGGGGRSRKRVCSLSGLFSHNSHLKLIKAYSCREFFQGKSPITGNSSLNTQTTSNTTRMERIKLTVQN